MAPARIQSSLEDEVRRLVDGVAGGVKAVEKAATRTRSIEEELAVGYAAAAEGRLRLFRAEGEHEFIVEGLSYAEAELPSPREADVVLRVDSHGKGFGAVVDTFLGFGHEAPHLAAGNGPSAIELSFAPKLALAHGV